MKQFRGFLRPHSRLLIGLLVAALGLGLLMLYKLGSLTGGLSLGEMAASTAPVGWHGIYHQPLYLPLKLIRSVVFALFTDHGRTLTRLPNAFFGALAIMSFSCLIRLWHNTRTALLAGLLFATSAWVLHVSRLASFDVLYLWALPTLLLVDVLLQKYARKAVIWYASIAVWGAMLYIPGLVWLVLLNAYMQKTSIANGWRHFGRWWQRLAYLVAGLVWLPLLIVDLTRHGQVLTWLGWPAHLNSLSTVLKHFAGVPIHLFIRGPQYPQLWLGRAPLLDVFTLAASLIGIFFYVTHWRASRSRLLICMALAGAVLVGLNGPVSLSLLVPLLYIAAAAGIAYLLREWFSVFPVNPLARGVGLGIIIAAICLSCAYNLKAYFVAWPHNQVTRAAFRYRR